MTSLLPYLRLFTKRERTKFDFDFPAKIVVVCSIFRHVFVPFSAAQNTENEKNRASERTTLSLIDGEGKHGYDCTLL